MTVYNTANYVTCIVESLSSFVLFGTFLDKRQKLPTLAYWIGTAILAVLISLSNVLFGTHVLNYIAMVAVMFGVSYLYFGSFKTRLFVSTLIFTLICLSELCVLLGISLLFEENTDKLISDTLYRLVGIFLSKLILFLGAVYIHNKFKRDCELAETKYWFLLVVVFIAMVVNMYIFYAIVECGVDVYIRNLLLVSTLFITVVLFAVLYLYETTLKQHIKMTRQQLEQNQLKEQLRHYDALILSQEKLRGMRHDMKNHLLSVYAKIRSGETDQCINYIKALLNNTEVSDVMEFNTGNTVLDAILNTKKKEAADKNIKFTAKLLIPADLPINESDVCIILGNALDNAIEACEKVFQNPRIFVSMVYEQGELLCKIENSCIKSHATGLLTTKDDISNHGIGKRNMRRALQNYDTICDAEQYDDKYVLSILFMNLNF